MAESAVLTPLSARHTVSPRDRSALATGISTLSSPTEETIEVDGATTTPSPPPPETRVNVTEKLSDGGAERWPGDPEPPSQGCVASSSATNAHLPISSPALVREEGHAHITAADYADRQRLLYHITYLSTQLQRAQLQVEDLTRTVCVLRGAVGDSAAATAVKAAVKEDATSAAVLAAKEERDVHAALQASLALFDPVIAQAQIYRLDDALAQVGLLREAELAQLRKANAALQDHRTLVSRLSEELAQLRSKTATLEQEKQRTETQLTAAVLEVEQLRYEERRLNNRVAGLEELAQDGTWMSNVRVVSAAAASTQACVSRSSPLVRLEREEQLARQALLLDVFWDPVLIAFDAGLTWLSDSAALQAKGSAAQEQPMAPGGAKAFVGERDLISLAQAGILVETPALPTDADLLLLQRQQEEVTQLRSRVQLLQERNRVGQLETERLQFLYEGEVRRSERMAKDHAAQLQQAYDEVVRDRQYIMNKLKQEVEDQIRLAYEDGRAYEKSRARSRRSQKTFRAGNAVL
ncbi:hypothetical protein conserved [Leishmania donovani]|uniref:Hypothetical_protein_conserved n=1 Tax=Leishmania donovani TaxID=5661 RepID=A0A3Q8IMW3_LEIDO|nr:hypothetical protein, conserved [Leishmania donovani]AYU79283.1 hypothetical protein LdCL_240025700 [Leishmania donovani]TPP52322.1 hypothetical protein CGC21_16585 [Leishmania donovani]CAJ1989274.1 hypothetical protein conserved [Leishmania donovani]CBZ34588.1 hypothetical protein, conserved [Leishmania donovani]VDZ45145.1 hypothetical_protein_conserved [Leishmania donovani]